MDDDHEKREKRGVPPHALTLFLARVMTECDDPETRRRGEEYIELRRRQYAEAASSTGTC